MSSNTIGPLPKKSDTPSEEVKKSSAPLPNKSYAPIEKVDKKGKSKPNVLEESITSPISEKNKIDTVNKTEISQTSNKHILPPKK